MKRRCEFIGWLKLITFVLSIAHPKTSGLGVYSKTNFMEQPPFAQYDVLDEGIAISTADGTLDVQTIFYDQSSVCLKTTTGEIWEYSDLETDDMVAIYESIYYLVYEKDASGV